MTTSLQDLPIALKVALAPLLVLLCPLAMAGVGYGVQRCSPARAER